MDLAFGPYTKFGTIKGILQEAVQIPFVGRVIGTEKVDGTNTRLIFCPDGSVVVGSREDLLWERRDLIGNPAMGIVEAVKDTVHALATTVCKEGLLTVFFVEVYGKPVFGGEGKKLEPIKATLISREMVKALKDLPRAEPLQETSDVPKDGATYVLRNISTRKGMIPDRDRTKMVQRAGKSSPAWKLKVVGDLFVIANATNGMVLDGSGGQLTQRRLNGAAGQGWTFVKEGDGYYIQCKGTGRVLDLEGGSIDEGARILLWEMKKPPGHLNQIWMLTEVKKE